MSRWSWYKPEYLGWIVAVVVICFFLFLIFWYPGLSVWNSKSDSNQVDLKSDEEKAAEILKIAIESLKANGTRDVAPVSGDPGSVSADHHIETRTTGLKNLMMYVDETRPADDIDSDGTEWRTIRMLITDVDIIRFGKSSSRSDTEQTPTEQESQGEANKGQEESSSLENKSAPVSNPDGEYQEDSIS